MAAQSLFGLEIQVECFLAMVTRIAEVTREVNTFNVIPDIDLLRVLLSTQRALEAWLPILKQGLLHVLVKLLSFIGPS